MVAANVTLGGLPLDANPEDIRWNFKIKTANNRMMGGKVIQILGATMGDITVTGHYGSGRRGDDAGWQNEARLQEQVRAWAEQVGNQSNKQALRFTYAPRGWDFQVFIRQMSPVHLSVEEFNPVWQMALVPVGPTAFEVVRGVKDLYIQRLMDGIGWKQSDYNGPTQDVVDQTLGGLSIKDYVAQEMGNAYNGTTGAAPSGTTVNTNPFFGGSGVTLPGSPVPGSPTTGGAQPTP